MGITGLGIATIVAQLIALLILLIKILKNARLIDFSIKYFYLKFNFLKNLFFQSAPITAALLSFTVGNTIILTYVGIFGEFATAGYGSATRFEQVLLLPVLGLNTAIISIIAQNYGAKNFLRVKESYFKAITYGFIIMIFSGLVVFLSADKIVSIFSENPKVIEFGAKYLKISAFVFPAYPIFFISNGLFMSLKRSGNAMVSNIIRNIILPLFVFYFVKSINGDFNDFFWIYCFTNWFYVSALFIFVIFYIKRKLN
jgi:Na+-driven multidrug efflux pump